MHFLVLAAVGVATQLAVAEQNPLRAPAPSGTIRGIVVAGADDIAVRGARVALILGSGQPVVVFSDEKGAFDTRLRLAAAGVLKITKAGYAPSIVPLGTEADGTHRVRLDPAAVLTGRVVDTQGNAITSVNVAVERLDAKGEQAVHAGMFRGRTDERGEFRIGGIPEGRHAVRVDRRNSAPTILHLQKGTSAFLSLEVESDALSLAARRVSALPARPPGGSIAGVIRDAFGDPLEDVGVRLWERVQVDGRTGIRTAGPMVRTDDRGAYRLPSPRPGNYYVVAEVADKWIDPAGAARSYLAEGYPGGVHSSEWRPIAVAAAANIQGIDLTFRRTSAPAVSGVARDNSGGPARGRVVLVPRGRDTTRFGTYNEALRADGTFIFNDVAPGDYVVQATTSSPDLSSNVLEFGVAPVSVSAAGAPHVVVLTSPVVNVSGRVTLEGSSRTGARIHQFTVYTLRDGDYAGAEFSAPTLSIDPDLSFRVRGLAGPTRFVLREAPPGWWLKMVNVDGMNAAETPVTFAGGGSRDDVTVVLAPTAAVLSGRVLDGTGGVRQAYTVVVFADDDRHWFEGSARVKSTGAAFADFSFRVHSLPPGDYLVAAIPPGPAQSYSVDWPDYELLGQLRPFAARISLREAEQRFVELPFADLQP